jgi:tetratricopeptide (TPR) repeat protein
MRTLFTFFLLLLPLYAAHAAQDPFARANTDYAAALKAPKEGAQVLFARAAEGYREAIANGGDSWAAHFNLANALHMSGRPGEAALEYERAHAIDPLKPEAKANLAVLRQAAGLAPERPMNRVEGWGMSMRLSVGVLKWAGALAFWGFLALVVLPFFIGGHRMITVFAAFAVLCFGVACAVGMYGWHMHAKWLIVQDCPAALRAAPDAEATALRDLAPASCVLAERKADGWLYVVTEQGDKGWLSADCTAEVWNRQGGRGY